MNQQLGENNRSLASVDGEIKDSNGHLKEMRKSLDDLRTGLAAVEEAFRWVFGSPPK